ncbi:glycolate oxidase subunit GlcE [Paenalcaligenes niemegkensis]|uniref:glycolate oxidase subunit GlcE n=1 Tax=Paenalcaligenes niemegkensis TaxID=2895469 RepID=UPI001EE8A7E5|nr:glycolate oxidase subunit GlcE [Paenalcaligenes niemegkensis]MCQ9618197.1 glycolate oxidase subunit GlcE [Paenalcaligenes niemegkensis]
MSTTNLIVSDWQDRIRQAHNDKTPLHILGSGSKQFYGPRCKGEILNVSANQGIVDYEPSELVITVKGGTPLSEIETLLASRKQFLAFEPPHFGEGATIAGCIASGLAGPRRATAGALKDFVLGVKIVDGQGQHLTFGGQVMKNVAGYDVSRLIAGSFGSLGVIDELSIKVLPIPEASATLALALTQEKALDLFNKSAGLPLAISATTWVDEVAYIRLSGAQEAIDSGIQKIGGDTLEADVADAFWSSIREQKHDWFKAEKSGHLWRLSVPSTCGVLKPLQSVMVEWGGALRWVYSDASEAQIREIASSVGGTANVFRGNGPVDSPFHPLAAPMLRIQQRLKSAFDPAGILNAGRIYPGAL